MLDSTPSISILGAGMMGVAIAAAHLKCDIPVVLYDNSTEALCGASRRVAEELRLQAVAFRPQLLVCTDSLDAILSSAILIETVTEKIRIKQRLYERICGLVEQNEGEFRPLLFSNTSTISISTLAEQLSESWRDRFCGFHFFHPVRQRSLLEIIAGRDTASQTVEAAWDHALRIDKRPIIVRDGPGFLVNRMLNSYLTAALTLLEEGVSLERIERIALEFGMKMGPFRIMDEIGLDVVLHAGWVLFKAFPERTPSSPTLLEMVRVGRLGRKTGQGFMTYPNSVSWEGEGVPDSNFENLFGPFGTESTDVSDHETVCISPPASPLQSPASSLSPSPSDGEIILRLFYSMYEEAVRCRNDGIIDDLAAADLASIHALGFPEDKGGVVQWGGSPINRHPFFLP